MAARKKPAPTVPLLPDLPKFEGRSPDGQAIKLTGTLALDPKLVEAHRVGDVVYVLTACKVKKVSHEEGDNGHMDRVEGLKVVRAALLDAAQGEKILHEELAAAGVTLV